MSTPRLAILILLAALTLAPAVGAEERTWSSADGRFKVVAEMLSLDGEDVRLRTADGRTITVPLSKLSERDRDYAREQAKQAAATPDEDGNGTGAKPGDAGGDARPPDGAEDGGAGGLTVDGITKIDCACRETGPMLKPGVYHYDLYLPPGYDTQANRRYACLFVMSPGGKPHSLFKMFERLARQNRWIVVLLLEARNGPWEPIVSNFVAAHDDVIRRCRVQQGMKFVTGTSGGALASSLYVTLRPGFLGMMTTAQDFYSHSKLARLRQLGVYFGLGRECYNVGAAPKMLNTLRRGGLDHAFEIPLTGHSAHSPDFYQHAFTWHEKRMYLQLRGLPRELAAAKFEDRLAQLETAADDLEKFDHLSFLNELAKRHKLTSMSDLKEPIGQVQEQLKAAVQDENLKKQLAARTAYSKAFQNEQQVWLKYVQVKANAGLLDRAIATINQDYQKVVDKHAGTQYADLARERIAKVTESKHLKASKPKNRKKR